MEAIQVSSLVWKDNTIVAFQNFDPALISKDGHISHTEINTRLSVCDQSTQIGGRWCQYIDQTIYFMDQSQNLFSI